MRKLIYIFLLSFFIQDCKINDPIDYSYIEVSNECVYEIVQVAFLVESCSKIINQCDNNVKVVGTVQLKELPEFNCKLIGYRHVKSKKSITKEMELNQINLPKFNGQIWHHEYELIYKKEKIKNGMRKKILSNFQIQHIIPKDGAEFQVREFQLQSISRLFVW